MCHKAVQYVATRKYPPQVSSEMVKRVLEERSYVSKAELPRYANWEVRKEFEKNQTRSLKSMKKYRYGYRLLFGNPRTRAYARRIGLLEPGKYEPTNQHGGQMFALPNEFKLSDKQAGQLLFKAYESRAFTIAQLKVLSKLLSYAFQLKGGGPKKNWPSIAGVWETIKDAKCAPQKNWVLPTRIPRPGHLKQVLAKPQGWTRDHSMSLLEYSRGLLLFWCWGVIGSRSAEDLKRIKDGDAHGFDLDAGWAWTKFKGGRCKLAMKKAGTRPWRAWFVCLCPGGKHQRVQRDIEFCMDREGNPKCEVKYFTGCPVACHELIVRCHWMDNFGRPGQDEVHSHVRIFNTWTTRRRWTAKGNGPVDLVSLAFEWMAAQGLDAVFDRNAGRKALSAWCQKLRIPYDESVQLHGDTENVWGGSYQKQMPPSGYKERRQSNDAAIATVALRKFALLLCGRGMAWKPKLCRQERFICAFLEAKGEKERAFRIAHDLPSEDEDEDFPDCLELSGYCD